MFINKYLLLAAFLLDLFLALSMVVEMADRKCFTWSKIISTCFEIEEASVRLSNSFTGISAFNLARRMPSLLISSFFFSEISPKNIICLNKSKFSNVKKQFQKKTNLVPSVFYDQV